MIRIGTSGFSYDDWTGAVYPAGTSKGDRFKLYCQRFDTVEINSTFYALSGPRPFERLAEQAPEGFLFAVKAYRGLTHEVESETFSRFAAQYKGEIAPLAEAGLLGAVLVQFPWRFKPTHQAAKLMEQLVDALAGLPLVFEFRNGEWARRSVFEWLKRHRVAYCCVDMPQLRGLMPPLAEATGAPGYVRFHGRNASKWWKHAEAWERYDYSYSQAELEAWVGKILDLEAATGQVLVYFNNHFAGQAVKNAEQFRILIKRARKGK